MCIYLVCMYISSFSACFFSSIHFKVWGVGGGWVQPDLPVRMCVVCSIHDGFQHFIFHVLYEIDIPTFLASSASSVPPLPPGLRRSAEPAP